MQVKVSARVVANRKAIAAPVLGVADGLGELAEQIVRAARPPDSPLDPYPTGEGLPKQGGWGTWVEGQKIGGGSLQDKQPKKPRSLTRKGIVAVAGFGFPGRLVELGTIRTHARPFLTEAVNQVLPRAAVVISAAVKRRMAGVRDTTVSDRIAASRAAKQDRLNAAAVASTPDLVAALRAAIAEQGTVPEG